MLVRRAAGPLSDAHDGSLDGGGGGAEGADEEGLPRQGGGSAAIFASLRDDASMEAGGSIDGVDSNEEAPTVD